MTITIFFVASKVESGRFFKIRTCRYFCCCCEGHSIQYDVFYDVEANQNNSTKKHVIRGIRIPPKWEFNHEKNVNKAFKIDESSNRIEWINQSQSELVIDIICCLMLRRLIHSFIHMMFFDVKANQNNSTKKLAAFVFLPWEFNHEKNVNQSIPSNTVTTSKYNIL